MKKFSIREIECLTGIKAGTIRMWEQRYNLVVPKRTCTNIRYYDDCDLKRLLNISVLNSNGYKVSEIAQLSPAEINDAVGVFTEDSHNVCCQQQGLSKAMINLDEYAFEKVVHTAILKMGFENTMNTIVLPFFKKIGSMWQTGAVTVAQEHFITHLVAQKIMVATEGQQLMPAEGAKKILLFLPEGEAHEIGLLYASYLLKARGFQVVYLGRNVPVTDLSAIAQQVAPHYAITLLTSLLPVDLENFVHQISNQLECPLIISGHQVVGKLQSNSNILVMETIEEFTQFLAEISVLSAIA